MQFYDSIGHFFVIAVVTLCQSEEKCFQPLEVLSKWDGCVSSPFLEDVLEGNWKKVQE
jgi:hypothetical protein